MFGLVILLSISYAIIIRDDVDDSQYRADSANHPEVFYLWQAGECAGTSESFCKYCKVFCFALGTLIANGDSATTE